MKLGLSRQFLMRQQGFAFYVITLMIYYSVLEFSPPEDFSHRNDLCWQMSAGVCVVRHHQGVLRHINNLWSNLVWFFCIKQTNYGRVGFGVELWDHDLHGLIVRVPMGRVSMRVAPSLVQADPHIRVMSSENQVLTRVSRRLLRFDEQKLHVAPMFELT